LEVTRFEVYEAYLDEEHTNNRAKCRDWIAAVDRAGGLFFIGAWLVVLVGFLGIVALVGFYDTLRVAGPVMIVAPILGAVG
jgi:hypothetical protein